MGRNGVLEVSETIRKIKLILSLKYHKIIGVDSKNICKINELKKELRAIEIKQYEWNVFLKATENFQKDLLKYGLNDKMHQYVKEKASSEMLREHIANLGFHCTPTVFDGHNGYTFLVKRNTKEQP